MIQGASQWQEAIMQRARTLQIEDASRHLALAEAYASGRKTTYGLIFGISNVDQASAADRDKARTSSQLARSLLDAADRGIILEKYIRQARKQLRKGR